MTNNSKQPWIIIGYELFARQGLSGLKIEVMARHIKKSKSSFYHHFADLEVFTEILLNYHLERARLIAEQEKLCKNVVPELLHVLLEVKQDLLFNRQLRVHRHNPQFKICFETASKTVGNAILGIWADALGLTNSSHLAEIVLNLSLENFFLQLTEETFTYDWLVNYIHELKKMVIAFDQKGKNTISVR
jgi:AcrR family transcriptional regulator